MIGSYRPVEVIVNDHPLKKVKQVLGMQRRCSELPLELLKEHEVAAYLEERFQGGQLPVSLVQLIYQRTDGNPLFLVNMVEYLLTQRLLGFHNGHWTLQTEIDTLEVGVPESLTEMIEQQLERLTHDEQRVLEAASVLGMQFSAAAVAAGLEQDLIQIEKRCDVLARRQHFLRAEGITKWPDGTVAARYRFLHWLYQHVAYHRMGVTQRVHLQQQIGRHLERAYSRHASV
jgi:predicted ATPase